MADLVLRRMPPLTVDGPGWSACAPRAAFSLRTDLVAAHSALAAARALAPTTHSTVQLSLAPCRAFAQGEWTALWLGPDEQLLTGPQSEGSAMAQRIEAGLVSVPHSLVDVSHRQTAVELRGSLATAMLNTGCPLDLNPDSAPVGFCTRTVFAKAEIVLWRCAEHGFQLQTWRSFLPYVTGLLAVAAEENGR